MASDVTIRGAGIFGLSVAWEILRRGARVTIVDPNGPGAGASGGVVGALAPHVPGAWTDVKQVQLDTLLAASDYWAEVASVGGGDPGYGRTGRLQPLAVDAAVERARTREAEAVRFWGDSVFWQVVPAPEDWSPASPTGLVVHDTLTARLSPAGAIDALARAVTARGGRIVTDGPEEGPQVWCNGAAGLEALSGWVGREVGRGIKGQAAVLDCDARNRPQIYGESLHIVPHANGTVAVGSTTERDFDSPTETDAQLDDVIERARAMMPQLQEARVLCRWAGLRPRTRSRAPIIGPWPDRPGHWVANGGFKIGFGVHITVAELTADLVLEGRDRVPDPLRLGL
ncbi:NAD(P)/FAD-dependent oxidoreductase [Palleronia caenipelagi]|uniref:FAD-binding oxidoreductase n=1 Tax=Palleronia caenipelagi TaxID=2489174 RepID=A0A547Q705_9RHOB|nr:FAD-dependent oxidoreductase [Palleronia caenipelagi]TRD22167.1 FAD-binding oxidoreductase [Palleronia caenipelagi]